MVGWVAGIGIRRHECLSKRVLDVTIVFIAVCIHLQKLSYAQRDGFLSIDCGNTRSNYTDGHQLDWVADNGTYIRTGQSSEQVFVNSSIDRALLSYRYFPEKRNKYCYELPTPYGSSIYDYVAYVIRASFYLNESVLKASEPFEFVVSVDATDWFTLTSGADSDTEMFIALEGIFYPPSNVTYFCLRPVFGVPFISSLELRLINYTQLYWYGTNGLFQYLTLAIRLNPGANASAPAVRYPDDVYDRIWKTPDATWNNVFPIISSGDFPENATDSTYYVPPKVMRDGWMFQPDGSNPAKFPAYAQGSQLTIADTGQYSYVLAYCQYLNLSSSNTYNLLVDLDSTQPFEQYYFYYNFSHQTAMVEIENFYPASDSINMSLWLYDSSYNTARIPDGPTLNGIEIFSQAVFNVSVTNPNDDQVIMDLKTGFSLSDWQGDPCVPVPHDWLTCTLNTSHGVHQYFVTSVTLSDRTISGFSKLAASSQPTLTDLDKMSITQSGVDTPTLKVIQTYISPGLSFLNLSNNALTSLPKNLAKATASLAMLDLSHNQLTDDISTLDEWVQVNSQTLEELNVSNNSLSGVFNSSLYFSHLPSLTAASFSHNSIEGTLDLNAWHASLQAASQFELENQTQVGILWSIPLFSFVDNNIVEITPNVETFASSIQMLLNKNPYFYTRGILLGGNPYCKHAKPYMQRYLCRSSIFDEVKDESKSKWRIWMISMISGVIGLLVFVVVFATMLRLWKQVHNLREIQKALADRQVQPPFYQYNDIKVATRDFHSKNKLGIGGFGVVYKGILADQKTVAVKTLFNSQSEQAIDEFLNEVVLITGIKHRNLVQLKGCCIKDKQRMLVYEYAQNGNLAEALWGSKAHSGLNWETRFKICVGVARGLSYLHEELQPSIIHRDIKPENILLDGEFRPKIGDFGLARHFLGEVSQDRYTHISKVAGTRGYFAPEYAMHGQLSEKADVYSYGILILEVVCGRKCIDMSLPTEQKILIDWAGNMQKKKQLFNVVQGRLRDNCVPAEVLRVLNIGLLCAKHDPEKRPSMSQVVTMLLGSIDMDAFDELDHRNCKLKNGLAIMAHNGEYPTLPAVEEDSAVFPLLDMHVASSPRDGSSGSHCGFSIELDYISGR